jgi:hypothetical protein
MKNQKLKIKNEDTLKGTGFGSLGWTESAKMNSTVKRLLGTFADKEISGDKKNKIIVQCSECNRTFKTTNGKLPEHRKRHLSWWYRIDDNGAPSPIICNGVIADKITQPKLVKKIVINDITFKVGDKVIYEKLIKGNIGLGIKDSTKLSEGVIDNIKVNNTDTLIYFKQYDGQLGWDYIKLSDKTEMIKL